MKRKVRSEKIRKWHARRSRTASSISGGKRPRLTVFRSAKHIYAQLVDGETGRTIGAASSRSKEIAGGGSATGNIEAAKKVGTAIAQVARENNIDKVVFNRNGFLYHGRVKALAEAAREAGLQF